MERCESCGQILGDAELFSHEEEGCTGNSSSALYKLKEHTKDGVRAGIEVALGEFRGRTSFEHYFAVPTSFDKTDGLLQGIVIVGY